MIMEHFWNYFSVDTLPWGYDLFIRLLLATLAGAVVGLEREYHGRPAGMRTHILVSLGSALISLISIEMGHMAEPFATSVRIQVDPGRIVQGVVTGIGFLGAGAIIKIGMTARGLTTAASLWCIAIVGMGFGFGIYKIPILGTLLMLFTLIILGRLEKRVEKTYYKTVTVKMSGSPERVEQLREIFRVHKWTVLDFSVEYETDQSISVEIQTRLNKRNNVFQLVKSLEEAKYIEKYKVH
jgi:putative Mg2+ transporter-C (MgtC) family protein